MNTAQDSAAAARLVADAWRRRERLSEPPPALRQIDEASAYAGQQALLAELAGDFGAPVGYKIGCTNAAARELLGLEGPFYGRLLSGLVRPAPARFDADAFFMRVIEPEFAFRLGRDLPARVDAYTLDELRDAVDAVLPAIEIVDSRYGDWTAAGASALIVDNGSNGAWVHGEPYSAWRDLDLAAQAMTLTVNDSVARTGSGALVLDNPLNSLLWLANTLAAQGGGRTLRAGDRVSTGVCCQVYAAERGDAISADFGVLGRVELTFS